MTDVTEQRDELSQLKRALVALKDARSKLETVERARREPIAVIGLGCRFPGGANNPEMYWQLLRDGECAITEVPPDRWDVETYYDRNGGSGKTYSRHGGFLDQVDQFDPLFFGISPREAQNLDPQQRLLLEVTWEALENAGLAPDKVAGTQMGVFLAASNGDYFRFAFQDRALIDSYCGTGTMSGALVGRLSYFLGVHGPSITVDTACSSSLVAVHVACQSLRAGECSTAIAGGVNVLLAPEVTIGFSKAQMISKNGLCKTFDADADGYVRGEGCGIVILKRLSDAQADGDNILAVIRGTAVNQDGRSNGLTAPNGLAQEACIRAALDNAGVVANEVSYVEAHGTGTPLGDPIEVQGLDAALCTDRPAGDRLVIGSVKTNIGHLEMASGVAGLIKTVLALQHRELPPHLHLKTLNPLIPWEELPLTVPTELTPWPAKDGRRIAGVSAYGFGGTNAHVVLEEAPAVEFQVPEVDRPQHVLCLSARGESALAELAAQYQAYLAEHPTASLADVAYTAAVGRSHFDHRLAVVAGSRAEAAEKLGAFTRGQRVSGVVGGRAEENAPEIAFLFTGQGSQYVGMGRRLYETEPTFRKVLDRCDELLRPYLEQPLLSVIHPEDPEAPSLLDETAYTQPALFAVEYALAELWRSWGIKPAAVMGHSVGEYVAACVAGVFSLEDGLKLIAERGRLMQSLPKEGTMASIQATEAEVRELMAPYVESVSIAAINGPRSIVLSGVTEAVAAVLEQFEARGVKTKRLTVSHAFHSPLMEPILDRFEDVARQVTFKAPAIPLVSNLTGQVLEDDQIPGASYWREHIREGVRFADALKTLYELNFRLFLEAGPSPTLLGMGRECIPGEDGTWLPSLRKGRDDWQQMLTSLGTLYTQGVAVDGQGFDRHYPRRRLSLPTYPFQRQRYWIKREGPNGHGANLLPQNGSQQTGHPLLGRRLRSFLKEIQFESLLATDRLPFLIDHQIYGTVVVPGAAFMELALAAASTAYGDGKHQLENFTFQEPLILTAQDARPVQVVLTPDGSEQATFHLASSPGDNEWRVHATGTIKAARPDTEVLLADASLETVKERFQNEVDVELFYEQLRQIGLDYGPHFQGLTRVWRGDGEALGQIRLPEMLTVDANDYHVHPALLDAAFHPGLLHCTLPLLGTALDNGQGADESIYIPVGFERLCVYRRSTSQLWSHVSVRENDSTKREAYTADLRLYDWDGQLVAEVVGMYLKRAPRAALLQALKTNTNDWLYEIEWKHDPSPRAAPAGPLETGNWLIFADAGGSGGGVAADLSRRLQDTGACCVLVQSGTTCERVSENCWQLRPTAAEDYEQLLRKALPDERGWQGIVHLWALDTPALSERELLAGSAATSLIEKQEVTMSSALHLVQALGRSNGNAAPLWLVTQGSQPVEDGYTLAPEQALLWGMGKNIALEFRDLRCVQVDLEPGPAGNNGEMLFEELWTGDNEEQVAFRGGTRYLARLVRSAAKNRRQRPDGPFELSISELGVLDNLVLQPVTRRTPGPGEVEIQVRATGVNFRDVLKGLGMYPGGAAWFGDECAGDVVAVGDAVEHLKVGDRVFGMAKGSFNRYVITPADMVVPIPAQLSYEEAATVPTTFLTAYYALHELGKIKPGERVLIHAAAGGVGVAATQLAMRAGAEVFATASPGKWPFLRSLGVKHIMNSRTLDFADEVLAATDQAGVDLVLNSLNGDFIPKSLAAMAPDGRFLEIGKVGIWDESQVKEVRPAAAYHIIFLDEVREQEPALFRSMLQIVAEAIAEGSLTPLPHHLFPIEKVSAAFRFMAQAKHVGKIVVTQRADDAFGNGEDDSLLAAEATYLITGGLGGLGLTAARWMAERGARHLVLAGRSAPSETAQAVLNELNEAGVNVQVARADISRYEDVARLLEDIEGAMPPLRGIVHTAGVLDDGILLEQDWSRFAKVMAPKMAGTWYLHVLTRNRPLDFFVLYSSITSVLGSAGQANYVGANAFMDVLAEQRRRQGRAVLSISWGPWAEIGMLAGLGKNLQQRWARLGMELIQPEQGVQVLEQLLGHDAAHVAVAPIDWSAYLRSLSEADQPSFLNEIARQVQARPEANKSAPGTANLAAQLADATPEKRWQLMLDHIRELARMVFALPTDYTIDQRQSFNELGLDSLMAVELGNALSKSTNATLPPTLLFDYPTLETLAAHLLNDVLGLGETTEEPDESGSTENEQEKARAELESLSDDEAALLLMAELSELKNTEGDPGA